MTGEVLWSRRARLARTGIAGIFLVTGIANLFVKDPAVFSGTPEKIPPASSPILALSRLDDTSERVEAWIGLDRRIASRVVDPAYSEGCAAIGASGAGILFSSGNDERFIPASTMKLFVSAAALQEFGVSATFTTRVWRDAQGVLYLEGGGDPTLATPEWAAARKNRLATPLTGLAATVRRELRGNVQRVQRIVADPFFFDRTLLVEGWEQRYIRQGVAPFVSALAVDRSKTHFPPGYPIPPGAVADPALGAAATLGRLLDIPDVAVTIGKTPADATLLAELHSPPLPLILADLNKWSDNFIAEVLVRHLGREAGDPTTAGGVRAMRKSLTQLGVDMKDVRIFDGSGLHRNNRVSCEVFVHLMDAMSRTNLGPVWFSSFSIGGTDGTLRKWPLDADVIGKTGTLNNVVTLVGRTETEDEPLFFAFLFNKVNSRLHVHNLQRDLIELAALWPKA